MMISVTGHGGDQEPFYEQRTSAVASRLSEVLGDFPEGKRLEPESLKNLSV